MEDFYYSYPAPKQDSGSNNLTFEAPLEQYTNQNSGKEQVRFLANPSQFQLRGGNGEEFTIEGGELGKTLFSKGVGLPAQWEHPGLATEIIGSANLFANNVFIVNCSSQNITVYLPQNATTGYWVKLITYKGASNNTVTVSSNSEKINNLNIDLLIAEQEELTFYKITNTWVVKKSPYTFASILGNTQHPSGYSLLFDANIGASNGSWQDQAGLNNLLGNSTLVDGTQKYQNIVSLSKSSYQGLPSGNAERTFTALIRFKYNGLDYRIGYGQPIDYTNPGSIFALAHQNNTLYFWGAWYDFAIPINKLNTWTIVQITFKNGTLKATVDGTEYLNQNGVTLATAPNAPLYFAGIDLALLSIYPTVDPVRDSQLISIYAMKKDQLGS